MVWLRLFLVWPRLATGRQTWQEASCIDNPRVTWWPFEGVEDHELCEKIPHKLQRWPHFCNRGVRRSCTLLIWTLSKLLSVYQFISKELPFIRKDQMRVSEIIGCRSCSHCVCDSGGTRQQPGEHHYWTSEKQAADIIYNQDLRQRGFWRRKSQEAASPLLCLSGAQEESNQRWQPAALGFFCRDCSWMRRFATGCCSAATIPPGAFIYVV